MAWLINHKLLADYQFKYCEVSFRAPNITNPDDQSKILSIVERAGGMTPNEAHRLAGQMVGETAEDYAGDWADVPLAVQTAINSGKATSAQEPDLMEQVSQKLEDAESTGNDELIAVMRQVRKALVELTENQAEPAEPVQNEPVKAAMSRFMMRPAGDEK